MVLMLYLIFGVTIAPVLVPKIPSLSNCSGLVDDLGHPFRKDREAP